MRKKFSSMKPKTLEPFELSRKMVHLLALFVPVVTFYHRGTAQIILIVFILFYSFSEWKKIRQEKFFAHPFISKMQRTEELSGLAKAPLFLAIGVLVAISFFPWEASLVGIYQAGFCDTAAAIYGKKYGKTRLPFFRRKTYAGSIAFLIAALPMALIYLPPSKAIVVAMVGAFLESLPFKDWDNLTVPILITFLADQFAVLSL